MKKLKRNAEKFDVLELFAEMAVEHGYSLNDPIAQDDFISRVRSSIEESKKSRNTVFGKRVESLFAYVVGALGKVILLKQEDSGDLYFSETEIIVPDYRLTFEGNQQILVEVKNCHFKNPTGKFSIQKSYYLKLKKYADLNGLELRFAIYFSSWNVWTLLGIDSFKNSGNSYTVDFIRAIACSEMSRLGDCMIATAPNLELQLRTKHEEACEVDGSGKALFIPREAKIYCAGSEITDDEEKKIAFYLMRFGTWEEKEAEAIIIDNKVLGVKFIYSPESTEFSGFAIIGNLSTMVTNGFKEHTVKNGGVVALKLGIDPSEFKVLIPEDYNSKKLPLWRFVTQPNLEFEGNSNH